MNFEQDPVDYIKDMLENKSTAKQTTYKNILHAYSILAQSLRLLSMNCKKRLILVIVM